MTAAAHDEIRALTASSPATLRIAEAAIEAWPEHAPYVARSLRARDGALMATTETLAAAALILAGDALPAVARNYRWTCDRLREEELFFHREGRYRLSTFAEADREVYSNADYMEKYMDGLLVSQVLWYNHAASCNFYLTETPRLLNGKARFLEIGPGHGLMMYLALRDFGLGSATAWDLSAVSIEQTRAALARLGFENARFAVQDLMQADVGREPYDLVVLSEVLEHLEDPRSALRQLRRVVADEGLIFVNVPINSPSPDHLYLMETLDDARALLRDTGFTIRAENFAATQATAIERALRNKVSISACMLASPTP